MDIHRCRFVPYPPSAINALAFSHVSSASHSGKTPITLRLAIGRANGDIEIWNPSNGLWNQEAILRGGKERSIEGLVWTQDPEDVDKHGYKTPGKLRLFSTGYSTAVTEWDLACGRPLRHSAGNYGEIWCVAAQPRAPSSVGKQVNGQAAEPDPQSIAVGCADGGIVLMSTADNDLSFTKLVARSSRKGARVLSVTFQNRHTIVAGHADSTIRIFDLRNGQQVRNMTLGAGPKGGPKETLVWSVRCLSDGSIVSGDSTGTVCFWDGKTYALTQRIKAHDADILDVGVSADGRSAFSGGMDRKTIFYRRSGGGKGGERLRWAKIAHSRLHEHDVKAMASFESNGLSILASGGLDTNPIIVPLQEFGKENHRALSSLPQQPALLSVPRRRLVVSWWDREISIWAISRRLAHQREQGLPQGRKLVAKIALTSEEFITCVDITSSGTLLAVSTINEVKLFRLRPKDANIRVQKLGIPAPLSQLGAKFLKFSPDSKWLSIVLPADKIQIHRLSNSHNSQETPQFLGKAVKLKRLHRNAARLKPEDGTLGGYNRSINRLAFSADSAILAATDLSGYIDTWVLEGHEDLSQSIDDVDAGSSDSSSSSESESENEERQAPIVLGQHWIRNPSASLLPRLPASPIVLSFRSSSISDSSKIKNGVPTPPATRHTPHPHSREIPSGEDRLLIVTAGNKILEFNVLAGRLSDWSRRNPATTVPEKYRDLRDQAKGLVWDVSETRERMWIYGVSWLWMFDLGQDMKEQHAESVNAETVNSRALTKRKREPDSDDDLGWTRGTGAGSKVPSSKRNTGLGRKMWRIEGDEGTGKVLHLERRRRDVSTGDTQFEDEDEYDEDEDREENSAEKDASLIRLRRAPSRKEGDTEADAGPIAGNGIDQTDDVHDDQILVPKQTRREQGAPYWHTFKYRPILGIVSLTSAGPQDEDTSYDDENKGRDDAYDDDAAEEDDDDAAQPGIEVALVERPLWEVDLPARFYGDQEWDP